MLSRVPIHLALTAAIFTGCASGPLYSEVKKSGALNPKKDQGMVLVYWKGGFAGAGARFRVYANDQLITKGMRRGAFISCDANPGQLRLASTGGSGSITQDAVVGVVAGGLLVGPLIAAATVAGRKKDRATFDVAAGGTYFVEMHSGFWHEQMDLRSSEKGEEGIKDCHWMKLATPSPAPSGAGQPANVQGKVPQPSARAHADGQGGRARELHRQ